MSTKRNYFAGQPIVTGYQFGKFLTQSGQKPKTQTVGFSGNESAYGRALPLIFGRNRLSDPILLVANPEGTFLTALFAVGEGPLATNATDNSQSTPLNAFLPDPAPPKGYAAGERYIRVNGVLRHDPQAGFGLQTSNGCQDAGPPGSVFFPNSPDFGTHKLALRGTAWVIVRIDTKDHPSVDLNGGSISATVGIAYGRLVRVYNSATITDYAHKATTNAAWALVDVMTSRRAGAGIAWTKLNLQSFLDVAGYNDDASVVDTVNDPGDGSVTVKRFTFNGALDAAKPYDEWVRLLCSSMSATKPFQDANGQYKIKSLKKEDDLSSVPVFTDKDAVSRNVLWENGMTTVRKFRRRRRDQIPNRIRANFINQVNTTGYVVASNRAIGDTTIFLNLGSGDFHAGDHVAFDGAGSYLVTSAYPGGGADSQITISPPLTTAVRGGASVSNLSDFMKVQFVIDDEPSQTLASDGTRQIVEKAIDLVGCSTLDQAARRATLAMRVGEFAEGGLSNNDGVRWTTFSKDSANVEYGDVVAVESSILDPVNERYFRITDIQDRPVTLPGGSLVFLREFEGMLHDNAFYDDTAYTITSLQVIDPNGANAAAPPPVTGLTVTDLGFADANGTLMTKLTVNYTDPNPPDNFRSGLLFRSNDDGSGNQVGDWRFVGEVFQSGDQLEYPVSGKYEWFALVSRPTAGHTPVIDALNADGTTYRYPRVRVLVDGKKDSPLSTPTGLTAAGRLDAIYLEWNAYTGADRHVFKRFNVYRGTTNDPNAVTTSLIAETDSNRYRDDSDTVLNNPSTTYYYWVKGVSWLEGVTINSVVEDGLSSFSSSAHDNPGTDTAAPSAPPTPVVAYESADVLVVGVDAGSTNYDTVESWDIQITTDATFATFPGSNSLNRTVARGLPDIVEFNIDTPGIYYIRARANNIFGAGAWSSTLTYTSTGSLNAQDTDVPDAPVNLALVTSSAGNPIAGNAYQVQYRIPGAGHNTASVWGRSIFIHTSNTLPSPTTAYDSTSSGVTGTLTPGSNRFQLSSSPFTAGQWVSPNTHDIIIFSPKRTGSPSWSLEAMLIVAPISGNGVNYIDVDLAPSRFYQNFSGLKFYIVQRGGNNHVWEKVKAWHVNEPDNDSISALRRIDFSLQSTGLFAFACLHGLIWGAGKLAGPTSSTSFSGLVTAELGVSQVTTAVLAASAVTDTKIATDAVTTPKILANNVTAAKIDVGDLFAQTITASGSITGATIRTAASGARVELDSTNGLRAYDSGGTLRTQIGLSGAFIGDLKATSLVGITGPVAMSDNGQNYLVSCLSSSIRFTGPSSAIIANFDTSGLALNSGYRVTLTAASVRVDSGQGIGTSSTSTAYDNTNGVLGYHSSTEVFKVNTSGSKINIGGTYYTLSVDGSGFVKAS